MALYELRTYSLYVGKLAEVRELYLSEGWPALRGHADDRLVGCFIGDVGAMNQIVQLMEVCGRCRPAAVLGDGVKGARTFFDGPGFADL